jgi:hypothetical protein
MKEQRIILSVVGQVLDGVDDNSLLTFIKMVNVELNNLIVEFDRREVDAFDKQIDSIEKELTPNASEI